MIVCDQDIVDRIRQILIGIPGHSAFVGVAQYRIEEQSRVVRFQEDACVTKVSPSQSVAVVSLVRWRGLNGKQRSHIFCIFCIKRDEALDLPPGLRSFFEPEQLIHRRVIKRHAEMHAIITVEPGRAQDKRPIIAANERKHEALRPRIVETALIQQRLKKPKRGMVVSIVYEFYTSAQGSRYPVIKWLERCSFGMLSQYCIQFRDSGGQLQQMRAVLLNGELQGGDLLSPVAAVVHEWSAEHFGVLHCVGVYLRRTQIGIHDFQVTLGYIAGSSAWRDQMRPCIPSVE